MLSVVLFVALSLLAGRPASAQPVAAFEWSMAQRLGMDADMDGIRDYYDNEGELRDQLGRVIQRIVEPDWKVDFDAGPSSGNIRAYRWSVNGEFAVQTANPRGFSFLFPAEGTYDVTLEVEDTGGRRDSLTRSVAVQDWLIVAVGDSYGSGEGMPDIRIAQNLLSNVLSAFDDFQAALADVANRQAELNRKLADLAAAISNVAAKLSDLTTKQNNLNIKLADATDAETKLNTWRRECLRIIPTLRCPGATTALINALIKLGIANASSILTSGFDFILGKINQAVDVARAAVNAAQSAYNTALAVRNRLQADVDALRALITDLQQIARDREDLYNNLKNDLRAHWQDRRCHRSASAGQARAARILEQGDPRTSVTFLHLSCSGATVRSGLVGSYRGAEPIGNTMIPPQINEVRRLVGGREIDALLISIGGNDVNFGPMIEACIKQERCHQSAQLDNNIQAILNVLCSRAAVGPFADECRSYINGIPTGKSALQLFNEGIATLPSRYGELDSRIRQQLAGLPPDRVYITEYPNASRDEINRICAPDLLNPLENLPGTTSAEWTWIGQTMIPRLNQEVRNTQRFGWKYVSGIFGGYERHGYCSTSHWFVRVHDAFRIQGNKSGAVHPTPAGADEYAANISAALGPDLYINGDLLRPRPPRMVAVAGSVRTQDNQGLDGVTLNFTELGGSATTVASGRYKNAVHVGWSGVVTPSRAGFTFQPPSRSYNNLTSDINNQDFTAIPVPSARFKRGDVNCDGCVDERDADILRLFLTPGGVRVPLCCEDAADANDDGDINLQDTVFILSYTVQGERPPPAPGPRNCGPDNSPDRLGCVEYPPANCNRRDCGGGQVPGDCTQDGKLDISDAVCIFGYLFVGDVRELPCGVPGTPSIEPADVMLLDFNGRGDLDITDGILVLDFLFLGGPPHALGRRCITIPGCPSRCLAE